MSTTIHSIPLARSQHAAEASGRLQTHIHIPTPGDHYSPATGSAIMTIIYEAARIHASRGGNTQVIVSAGTRHDYPVGECFEVAATPPPKRWQKAIDLTCGRFGFDRPFGTGAYRRHAAAIPTSFAGTIFIHNDAASIALFKREHPHASVCLWANNELFGTYGDHELKRVYDAADCLICCSHYIADQARSRLDGNSTKLKVVHSGVDTDRFCPPIVERGARDPVILFVGRVQPIKGPDLLLRAAVQLARAQRDFKVRIVGSSGFSASDPLTPYEQELRTISQPIRNLVEFQSFVDRDAIIREYQQADIFVVPSNWNEPFGLTVLEGMACGLPTIAARRGGIPEIGGDSVLYFEPPGIEELARHLNVLLKDSNARKSLGRAARARAATFSWPRQYDVLMSALGSRHQSESS
jgi:glycosyltransferase involved in cell wall biosynthesis